MYIFLILFFLTISFGSTESYQKAKDALNSKNHELALSTILELIKNNQNNDAFYYLASEIYYAIGDLDNSNANILNAIEILDYILIMSVFPGFGGQSFIDTTLNTMDSLVKITANKNISLGVDGGVNLKTINKVYNTGIDIVIVGSGLYGADNIPQRYNLLMNNE